ncbi:MAG TPA: cbb3-type cytochrome c oxidase subunit I [Chloroflexia bacterium]|nr:cbb3-type cytochrome c oxidase subunit I [Chloroflexia bacterium]
MVSVSASARDIAYAEGRAGFLSGEGSASRNFLFSAIFWLTVADFVGLIAATEMISPDFLAGIPWLVFGRLRPIHTNGVLFLWLSMAQLGAFFYIVPRLCGRKLWSETIGNITCILWNVMGILGVLTLAMGLTQAREYAELIWPLDVMVMIALLLAGYNIYRTIMARKEKKLFVSLWYIMGTMVWMPMLYFAGNVMWQPVFLPGEHTNFAGFPSGSLTGINDVTWQWFYGHNVLGYWFTTSGVAIVYYMIPVIIRSPIYSHLLGLIGFWSIAFFYGLVGQHHILQSPTPNWLKTLAVVGSLGLFIPVFTFLTNIWMTMRGNWGKIYESLPLKFIIVGTIFYFVTCIQGPLQAIQGFNRLIHFTNWIVGHAHLALLGTFSFWAMGAIYYIIPVTLKKRIYSPGLAEAQFWMVTVGFLLMMISLQVGGLVQGAAWLNGDSVQKVLPSIKPYLIIRAIAGALIVISGIMQAWNIYKTVTSSDKMGGAGPTQAEAPN